MATKLYDLKVKTGEYTNQQGEKKGRYVTVGRIMQADDGKEYIMLDRTFNPAGVPDLTGRGGDSILISKFEPNDNKAWGSTAQSAPAAAPAAPRTVDDLTDDIPF